MLPAFADIIQGAEGAAFAFQDDTPAKRRESCVRRRTLERVVAIMIQDSHWL
jgi:hypothetical protein